MDKRKKEKIRKVKSHVKVELCVGVVKGKSVVVGINVGKAYSDEHKLLKPILDALKVRAMYFLADAYYGNRVKVLQKVKELGIKAIVPIRDSLHKKVKDPYRLWAEQNYEERKKVYRRYRYRVEQVIGIVKNLFGDRDMVLDRDVATLYALARFAIYNLIQLLRLLFLFFKLLRWVTFFKASGFFKQASS